METADQLNLQVLPGFVEMPHLDDPELLAQQLREVVDVVAAEASDEGRESLLTLYRSAYASLLAEGVIYVGYGYFRTDDGGISMAALNVFVKEHEEANPHLIVSQTVKSHSEGGPAYATGMSATALELPCGPAAFVLRTTLAPDGAEAASPLAWQAQAVVPFPQGKKVVVIDLSTPCPTEAPYYAGMLDGMARTISFTSTEPEESAVPEQADENRSRISQALG